MATLLGAGVLGSVKGIGVMTRCKTFTALPFALATPASRLVARRRDAQHTGQEVTTLAT